MFLWKNTNENCDKNVNSVNFCLLCFVLVGKKKFYEWKPRFCGKITFFLILFSSMEASVQTLMAFWNDFRLNFFQLFWNILKFVWKIKRTEKKINNLKVFYLLSRESLKASAVEIKSTYACSSNRLPVTFKLWFNMANLNADWTSSVPCSKIAPENSGKNKSYWMAKIVKIIAWKVEREKLTPATVFMWMKLWRFLERQMLIILKQNLNFHWNCFQNISSKSR